jgi:cytochrome c peroxidase
MLTASVGCVAGDGEAAPPSELATDAGAQSNGDGHDHVHAPPAPAMQADAGAADAVDAATGDGYVWDLPEGFPVPKIPEDNPMSDAKVELGRYLFYDTRLSGNQTQSCATCHRQELAFTDGMPFGVGSTGESHVRSSMSLANVAYASTLTWVNPVLPNLERQALVPLFGEDPIELGMVGREEELLERVSAEPIYQELFPEAFPERDGEISEDTIVKAIAAFERTIISGGSPYDRYLAGEPDALSEAATRGMDLFFAERTECFHCHNGFNLSDSTSHEGKAFDEIAFHNTGLYNVDGRGGFPERDPGLFTFTGKAQDEGRFKAPTLRNVAVTAPYMHDGSVATLEEVIDHYAAGGRTIEDGPYAGVGSENPNRSEFVTGFEISEDEKRDLIAFLRSLTDETLLEDPRFADPWPAP